MLQIGEEEFGLASDQGQPLILGPGVHVIDNPFFAMVGRVPQSSESISHQTLHRVIVPEGKRGIAMDGDKPLLLTPGIYQRKSPLFKFKVGTGAPGVRGNCATQRLHSAPSMWIASLSTWSPSTSSLSLTAKSALRSRAACWTCCSRANTGSMPRKTKRCGECGNETRWTHPSCTQFLGFLPTTEQVREMSVLDILTSDGLLVRIKGSVSFRVRDPDRALKNIGHYEALDSGLTQREKGKIRELLFGTILKRCNDTLASLLTGSDLLTSGGLG